MAAEPEPGQVEVRSQAFEQHSDSDSDSGSGSGSNSLSLLGDFAVERAALLIQQAVDGVERSHIRNTKAARAAFVTHLEILPGVKFCAWAFVLLTFFERPLWCRKPEMTKLVHLPCENPMYPAYPINYLTTAQGFTVEMVLVAPIVADNMLLTFCYGRTWWRSLSRNRIILLAIYAVDLVYALLTPEDTFRLAPYLRIGFAVLYSHATRNRLKLVGRTLPAVVSIFLLGFLFIVFFAWIGVIFFPADTSEGKKYFDGIGPGMWSFLILITTANFPDVMMPVYVEHREFVLFFVAFITLGVYFLVNMLTAVIFNVYEESTQNAVAEYQRLQSRCLANAYAVLAGNGGLSIPRLKELFAELNHYHEITYITQAEADAVAALVDTDQNGEISEAEFSWILKKLSKDMRSHPRKPWMERCFPRLSEAPAWRGLKKVVDHHWFDAVMDIFLVCTLGFSMAETWDNIIGSDDGGSSERKDRPWSKHAETIFCIIFVIEMCLKMAVQGEAYWKSPRNMFDCAVTIITTMVTVYVYSPNAYNNSELIRFITAFRAFRVLRLLVVVPAYRVIVRTFLRVLPDVIAMVQVIFCAMYVFSALGLQIFGGVINTDPASEYSAAVAESAFGAAGYYVNNFNDMPSAMVLLFELLVVNNWFVLADGFTAACGPLARLYFVAFYIFGVLICLNIVVAFILDGFLHEFKSTTQVTLEENDDDMIAIRRSSLAGE